MQVKSVAECSKWSILQSILSTFIKVSIKLSIVTYILYFVYFLSGRFTQSKKEDKDQESIQSSTTSDRGYQWKSDNVTIRFHKQKPRGQEVSHCLAGDHKA